VVGSLFLLAVGVDAAVAVVAIVAVVIVALRRH
jgi:hypothetical protein